MARHERGLYEVLITEALEAELRDLDDRLEARRTDLRTAEAADRLALHLSRIVQRTVAAIDDDERVAAGVVLARKLIEVINQTIETTSAGLERPVEPGAVLRAVLKRQMDGKSEVIPEPLIPL